jgi:hypothetical protein
MNYRLSRKQIRKLRKKYRKIEGQRHADRIRIVLAIAEGFSSVQLSKIFFVDADTIRRYFRLYKEGGINGLFIGNSLCRSPFVFDGSSERELRNRLLLFNLNEHISL